MWKTRKAPKPLDFAQLNEELSTVEPGISSVDQRVWTASENMFVFKDRLEFPS